MKALWNIFVNRLAKCSNRVCFFLMGAVSGLGIFEKLFITASGKISEIRVFCFCRL